MLIDPGGADEHRPHRAVDPGQLEVLLEGEDLPAPGVAAAGPVGDAEVVAVGSRQQDAADAFAERFSIPSAHGSYAELYANPDVDVVYIASPHSHHHEMTLDALRAGKHVLCEKAFALNASQAREMVAVARAMMSAPRLLLLDEPSLGLAPRMVDELLAIARRIADAGTTVLLVEQNVRKALAVADRGHVFERGRIVASGSATELARSDAIRHAYLGAAPAASSTSS